MGYLPHSGNQGFERFFGLPYSHEEGYPGPPPSSIVWPPVPLFRFGYPVPVLPCFLCVLILEAVLSLSSSFVFFLFVGCKKKGQRDRGSADSYG